MNVGLAHDYLLVYRGAERTFAAMADLYPSAPIYTTLYDERGIGGRFSSRDVRTSFLQRLPVRQKGFRALLPLFPAASKSLDARAHDVIVSSSSAWAHGVRQREDAVHVCYCHTPFRYVRFERHRALAEVPRVARPVFEGLLTSIRHWDERAHEQVTHHVANGRLTRDRIAAAYNVGSTIIHPPVEVDRFTPAAEPEDYLLVVGELTAHKRVEVALEAAQLAGIPIRVVGEGPLRAELEARYPNATFLGRVGDEDLNRVYAGALAMVVANVEEFGIAAVEAQAAGRPVVANADGGALETVLDGETGVLVPGGSVEAFAEALHETDFRSFDSAACRRNAERFSTAEFKRKFGELVERAAASRN